MRPLVAGVGAPGAVVGCLLVPVLVVSALSLDQWPARLVVAVTLALLALLVLLVVPAYVLPTVALATIAVIPDRAADVTVSPVLTPATAVLSVWLVRKLLERAAAGGSTARPGPVAVGATTRRLLTAVALLFGALLVPLTVVSPAKPYSLAWSVTFLVAVAAPLLVPDVDAETRLLARALPWCGAVAAAYVLVDSRLQQNPVYAPIYAALGKPEVQHWAVYRADGSLGHPLLAGLFLSVVFAYCLGRWLETHSAVAVVAAVLSGFGIVATVSRGAYAATAVAVAALILVAALVRPRRSGSVLVVLGAFTAAALLAVNAGSFTERGASLEAQTSAEARSALPQIAWQTAQDGHWLGGGPSASQTVAEPYNFQRLPIENSYLQLLISVGLAGLVLFVAILGLAAVLAVRRRNLAALAALVAYAMAISGFAALDARRNLVVLLGVLVLLCIQDGRATRAGVA